jgi:hypothetical protein
MNFPGEIKDMHRPEVIVRPDVIPGTVRNSHTVGKHLLEEKFRKRFLSLRMKNS